MKTFHKALGLSLAMALVTGCASTSDQSSTAESEAARMEAERAAAAAEAARQAEAEAAKQEALASLQGVIYFDFDKATLSPATRAALDAYAAYLNSNGGELRIEGHTDERGTREYNMALGERRANAVANYLMVNGVSNSALETVSYGEERPAVNAHNESAWQQNRRAELKLN